MSPARGMFRYGLFALAVGSLLVGLALSLGGGRMR